MLRPDVTAPSQLHLYNVTAHVPHEPQVSFFVAKMSVVVVALGAAHTQRSATPTSLSPRVDTSLYALLASEPGTPGKSNPEPKLGTNSSSSQKLAHCKVCSEIGWNCCGPGGSWDRLCPKHYSWEEGHDACEEHRLAWEKEESTKINKEGRYRMSSWASTDKLNHLFKHGVPSNDLRKSGLLIHGFDGTENWASQATWKGWFPCDTGFCHNAETWWSGSIINTNLRASFGDAAIILSPSQNVVMCSYSSDAGTLSSGCANQGGGYFGPNETEGMLRGHTNRGGSGYNEVMIDMEVYVQNLPKSVAGIVYGLKGDGLPRDEARAHMVYVRMLDRYNLTEASFPLLKANYMPSGQEPFHGPAFVDMSEGARDFLKNNTLTQVNPLKQEDQHMQKKWDRAHPGLKDHPERMYRWMRERSAIEQGQRHRHTLGRKVDHDSAKALWISTTP